MEDIPRTAEPDVFKKPTEDPHISPSNMEIVGTHHKARSPSRGPPIGLEQLPFEIRQQIYHHAVPRGRIVSVWDLYYDDRRTGWFRAPLNFASFRDDDLISGYHDKNSMTDSEFADRTKQNRKNNSIFLLSKQISRETLDVLYGENLFRVALDPDGQDWFKNGFTEDNRRRIRYLIFIARPQLTPTQLCDVGWSDVDEEADDALWSGVLPTLKGMLIVANHPIGLPWHYFPESLKESRDSWLKEIRTLLECFGRHLSSEAAVEIDGSDHEDIYDLAKECLANPFKKAPPRPITTTTGNFQFQQVPFLESARVLGRPWIDNSLPKCS